ncbi:MAG: PIN domain-containing protein [Caldimonas sp.]
MILVDTSVWVDHLRRADPALAEQLAAGQVLTHPLVIGEIACGVMPRRAETLALLHELPSTRVASHAEVLAFIERRALTGRGVGYIDLHLVASAMMTPHTRLWTRDRRLAALANGLGVGCDESELRGAR